MLLSAGLKSIEAGSFVSSKWVPQMKNSKEVFEALKKKLTLSQFNSLSALTPNKTGKKII